MNISQNIISILSFTNTGKKHMKNAINLWYILHVDKWKVCLILLICHSIKNSSEASIRMKVLMLCTVDISL